jgi:hypothetical protein
MLMSVYGPLDRFRRSVVAQTLDGTQRTRFCFKNKVKSGDLTPGDSRFHCQRCTRK